MPRRVPSVFCRILTSGVEGADWPLSRKFGCDVADGGIDVLVYAAPGKGLESRYGVSFHVGSQQRDQGSMPGTIATGR